jgi:hypothetical protein
MFFKTVRLVLSIAFVGVLALPWARSQAENLKEAKHSVAEIMQATMKKGQWKKLANGEASKEDTEKLLQMFDELHLSKAPHGDAKSWEEKTTELWEAAQAVAKSEKGATDRLKKAANCRTCHQAHKE